MVCHHKLFFNLISIAIIINSVIFPEIAKSESAMSYFQQGNFSKAVVLWKEELENYQKQNHPEHQIKIRLNLVQAYNQLGFHRLAHQDNSEALKLANNHNFEELKAIAYTLQGDTYQIEKNWEQSIATYEKSLKFVQDSEWQVATYNSLVKAYQSYAQELGRKAEIVKKQKEVSLNNLYYETQQINQDKAKEYALMTWKLAQNQSNLNTVQAWLNLESLSPSYPKPDYSLPLKILNKSINSRDTINLLFNLAQYVPLNQKESILITAQKQAEKLGDQSSLSLILTELSKLQSDLNQALNLGQQAQLIAQQNFDYENLYLASWETGKIYHKLENFPLAKEAYRQAISSAQKINSSNFINDSLYREFIDLLLETNEEQNIKEALKIGDLIQLSNLQNYFGDNCIVLSESNQTTDILTTSQAALIRTIILPNYTYLILKLPEQISTYKIKISQSKLEQKVQLFYQQLNRIDNNNYLSLAQELYHLLINPIKSELEKNEIKNLIFVNDGVLRNIPMATLYHNNQFLIENYGVVNSLGLNIKPLSDENRYKLISFGISEANNNFNELPFVVQEIKAITELKNGDFFLNEKFTKKQLSQVINNNKSENLIIHIASHGKFTGLLENSYIQAWDKAIIIPELELLLSSSGNPIELLILSACESSVGNDTSILGLAGVALRSNVKQTIGTLWPVNDSAMSEIMTEFYSNLGTMNPAEALRVAQIKELQKLTQHPQNWGSLIFFF